MKAGLAAIVGAVAGLQRLGLSPGGHVTLQSVVEEECTGNGALACVLAGHTADAAILTEPTAGAVWSAQVGVLWFQVHYGDTPAVCLGPLSEHEHGVDERVHVPSITTTAQQVALFIKDWCGLSS